MTMTRELTRGMPREMMTMTRDDDDDDDMADDDDDSRETKHY